MNARESVEKVVFDALVEFGFERDEISMDVSLADLDVSSLDVVELMQIVEHEFGAKVQPQQIHECETLGQLIDLVTSQVEAAGAA
jgi:acyl carrier protein